MKRSATYVSCMHVHVRYYVYEPKVVLRVKGIVQIHHGLGEHADNYDHFASYLLGRRICCGSKLILLGYWERAL